MIQQTSIREATEQLAKALRDSDECRQFLALKEEVMASETNRALLKEYQRTQTRLQMAAVGGQTADSDDVERFSKLSTLLYMNTEVAQYLVAQLRVQQLAGEVFQSVANAAGLEMELPGM